MGNISAWVDDNAHMKRLGATPSDHLLSSSASPTLGPTGPRCPTCAGSQEFRQLLESDPRGSEDDGFRSVSGSQRGRPLGDEPVGGLGQRCRRATDDSEAAREAGAILPERLLGLIRCGHAAGPTADPAAHAVAPVDAIAGQIVRAVSVHQVSGNTTLRLQVSTPQLSRLDVDLRIEGGRVSVSLAVTDAAEYRLVRAAMPDLEASLRERSIDVAPVRIQLRPATEQGGDQPRHRAATSPLDEPCETAVPALRRATVSGAAAVPQRGRSGTDYVL